MRGPSLCQKWRGTENIIFLIETTDQVDQTRASWTNYRVIHDPVSKDWTTYVMKSRLETVVQLQ
jgi:hypothetical protein